MKRFGEITREHRLRKEITLRQFCRMIGYDPSNWSKIERGILPPPKKEDELKLIANSLSLRKDSDKWHTLFEYAAIENMPAELISNKSAIEKLPVFFRTVRGKKPTNEELGKLIAIIMQD